MCVIIELLDRGGAKILENKHFITVIGKNFLAFNWLGFWLLCEGPSTVLVPLKKCFGLAYITARKCSVSSRNSELFESG